MYPETTNDHQMTLLKLQGSAAQLLANYVNESSNRKKKMEAADVYAQVEECRKREDMMMQLDRNMTTSYLPAVFGVEGAESGLYIDLNKRIPLDVRKHAAEVEEQPVMGLPAAAAPAAAPPPPVEEAVPITSRRGGLIKQTGPVGPGSWQEYQRIAREQIATLLLANNNPMFSLCHEINPYPEQCLKEVLPGASMVVVPTFELICQLADDVLTESLVQIGRVKKENGSTDHHIRVDDVRDGLRNMATKNLST